MRIVRTDMLSSLLSVIVFAHLETLCADHLRTAILGATQFSTPRRGNTHFKDLWVGCRLLSVNIFAHLGILVAYCQCLELLGMRMKV